MTKVTPPPPDRRSGYSSSEEEEKFKGLIFNSFPSKE